MACRLINDEDYLELRKVVINHKATQLMFRFNNDNPMDFTPDGKKSLLVEQMQKEFGRDAALFLKYLTFYSLKRYNEDGTPSLILKDERLANLEEIRKIYELDSNVINDPRYAIYDRPIKNKNNIVTNNMRLGTFDYLSAAMFRTNLPIRTIIRKVLNMTGGIRGVNSNKVVSPQAVVLVNQALKAYYKQIITHTDDVKLIVGYGGNKLMFDSKYLDQLERARAEHWNEYRRLRRLNGDGDPGLAATSSALAIPDIEELFESNPELANAVYEALGFKTDRSLDIRNSIIKAYKDKTTINLPITLIEDLLEFDRTKDNYGYTDKEEIGRKNIDKLKESIKKEGLKEPVELIINSQGAVVLGEGNHRFQALKELGYKEIPTIVKGRGSKDEYFTAVRKGKQVKLGLNLNKDFNTQITPQQKQQAQQLYAQYLNTKQPDVILPIGTTGLTTINESEITYTDEEGNPCAKMGGRSSKFTKGSQWEIVKDLKGYPSHAQGGVDIKLGKDGFSFTRGEGQIKATYGLVLTKVVP